MPRRNTRLPVEQLPNWRLYLPRMEAAAFMGLSPSLFDLEVKSGRIPAPKTFGSGQQRPLKLWNRLALERIAAAEVGLSTAGVVAPAAPVDGFEDRRRACEEERKRAGLSGRQHRHAGAR